MKTLRFIIACLALAAATSCASNQTPDMDNPVIENIMARRSIRQYSQEPVDREVMTKILECGINAPNGQNRQSWEVRVIDDPELMQEIKDAMAAAHPDMPAQAVAGSFRNAPTMVFIARDPSYDFSAYDCGLLAQNMMLSAWSLGVGSICLGSPVRYLKDNEICKPYLDRLGFSEGYEFCLCIGFGYALESPDPKSRDMGKVKFVD